MVKRMRLSPGNVEADWDLVEGHLRRGREGDSSAAGRLAVDFSAGWSWDLP